MSKRKLTERDFSFVRKALQTAMRTGTVDQLVQPMRDAANRQVAKAERQMAEDAKPESYDRCPVCNELALTRAFKYGQCRDCADMKKREERKPKKYRSEPPKEEEEDVEDGKTGLAKGEKKKRAPGFMCVEGACTRPRDPKHAWLCTEHAAAEQAAEEKEKPAKKKGAILKDAQRKDIKMTFSVASMYHKCHRCGDPLKGSEFWRNSLRYCSRECRDGETPLCECCDANCSKTKHPSEIFGRTFCCKACEEDFRAENIIPKALDARLANRSPEKEKPLCTQCKKPLRGKPVMDVGFCSPECAIEQRKQWSAKESSLSS